jgi:hypothetical protein
MSGPSAFDLFAQLANEQGIEKSLDFLEHRFRTEKEFFKLFEVLKMRCRLQMGLPLITGQPSDDLTTAEQNRLEGCLLGACRDVGSLLMKAGRLQEGWMYLQPVGDRHLSEQLIRAIEPDEENVETVVEIALSQGAAPAYGYRLLLDHYGTCNAITTFDTQAARFDRSEQKAMASLLLNHLYKELCENLRFCVEQNEQSVKQPGNLAAILQEHSWLIEDGAHHIDTTHLASVVRISRLTDSVDDIEKALELADYGSRLHQDFQYPSPPPFESTYADHQAFFRCLLGEEQEATISRFRQKCQSVDVMQYGPVAYETLADLLLRIGRNREAIEVLTDEKVQQLEPMGIAPQILEIADTPEDRMLVREHYRSQHDLLGFAASILLDKTAEQK